MKFTGGLPETRCGAGSTLKVTEHLRQQLPALLKDCGITTLLDAPCGDGNWIAQTDLSGIRYWGMDCSAENLQTAISRDHHEGFRPERLAYEKADLTMINFPMADAIMCRDFFQHLPQAVVTAILSKIRRSSFKWLLATSFGNLVNDEIGPDGFRQLNLQAAPFDLGLPEFEIQDPPDSGRILGAWRLC